MVQGGCFILGDTLCIKPASIQDTSYVIAVWSHLLQVSRFSVAGWRCADFWCSECVKRHLKKGSNECPQCNVLMGAKSINRNSSFSTMIQCVGKLRALIEEKTECAAEPVRVVCEAAVDAAPTDGLKSSPISRKELPLEVFGAEERVEVQPIAAKKSKPEMGARAFARIGLLLTGLSEDQRVLLQENIAMLTRLNCGLSFEIERDYSSKITHIVCACAPKGRCPRTLKYLLGIAGKAWIVSFSWVLDSLAAGRLLPEADYVVVGDEAVQSDTNACERSRRDAGRLFDGCEFVLSGGFSAPGPSKTDLTSLVRAAGGKVVSKSAAPERVFTLSNNPRGPKEGERPYTWLFDSVSQYQIID